MLWLFKTIFHGFCRFLIHGNTSYVVLYAQCLRYNICSVWFLDIRTSTCYTYLTYSMRYTSYVNCIDFPIVCCTSNKVLHISYALAQSYEISKSKKVVNFYVHISPIFSCQVKYTDACNKWLDIRGVGHVMSTTKH